MGKPVMRALGLCVVASLGCVFALVAEAVPSASIAVTVTIQNLSVSISDGAVEFGVVAFGSRTVSSERQVVLNDGNAAQTYALQLAVVDQLTAGETETAAGDNTFVLQALFTGVGGGIPSPVDFGADPGPADDVVKHSAPQSASSDGYGFAGGTGAGSSVLPGEARELSFQYSAPTSDTVTNGVQEDLAVTIIATAA